MKKIAAALLLACFVVSVSFATAKRKENYRQEDQQLRSKST